MKKVINCNKEHNPVINKKLEKVSLEGKVPGPEMGLPVDQYYIPEGHKIATELLQTLTKHESGIGLAANQIGMDKQVAVVNVREPLILINPEIVEQWDEIPFYEGCLSFPKRSVHTKRYKYVIIKCDNYESQLYFGPQGESFGVGIWENGKSEDDDLRLLEAVCVQHEVGHLNGMTIHDREYKPEPIKVKKGFGRNEKVDITDGKELKTMKYKKAKPLIDSGKWEIYIGGPIT